jgi:MFS family permease
MPAVATAEPLRRNRDFQTIWAGGTISELGSSMSFFVFPLIGYAVSGSAAQAAFVETAYALGRVAALLPAGVLVDRWSRRTVLFTSNAAGVVLYASLALATGLGVLTIAQLALVGLATGVTEAFFQPAETAAVRQVVTAEQLTGAIAQNQARSHVASLVGGPLGGALYSVARFLPFGVDAASFGVTCLAISRIRAPLAAPVRSSEEATTRMRADVLEGLRFLWASRFLRVFLGYAAVSNAGSLGFFVVLDLRLLQAGVHPAAIGAVGTFAGVAGITGAAIAAPVIRRTRTGWLAIVSAWAWVVATLPMPYTTNVIVIGCLLSIGVLLNPIGNAALSSYRIAITPDHLQGRSQTAMNFTAMLAMPIGPLLGGLLMSHFGAVIAMNVGIAALAAVALLLTLSGSVRRVPPPGDWER